MTDHKNVSKDVEKAMLDLHAAAKAQLGTTTESKTSTSDAQASSTPTSQPQLPKTIGDETKAPSSAVSEAQKASKTTPHTTGPASTPVVPVIAKPPVFFVRMVLEGSPAATAGLIEGDELVSFGTVTRAAVSAALRNHEANETSPTPTFAKMAMQLVAEQVRGSVGVPIELRILRSLEATHHHAPGLLNDDGTLTLSLTPQAWEGKGLLGCEVVPIPPR